MRNAAKTERFELRLDPGILEDVDAWRGRQADVPSRAEAVRRLIDAGLAEPKGSEIRGLVEHLRADWLRTADVAVSSLAREYSSMANAPDMDEEIMYEVININTGKIVFGLFRPIPLSEALTLLADNQSARGRDATVKSAMADGYRIVRKCV